MGGNRNWLQLQTTKHDNFDILWLGFFVEKLTSDLDSAGRNTSKNISPKFFPWGFRVAKFLGQKNETFCMLVRVQNGINGHHCPVRYLMVLSLLPNGPCSSIASKPLLVCTHEPPGTIDKSLDHVRRACIKILQRDLFRFCKILLWQLAVMIFDPSPVLE